MQLELRDGLLWLNDLSVSYQGQSITIPDILIDSGSASTLLDSDWLAQIGAVASGTDRIRSVFGIGEGQEFVVEKVVTLQVGEVILEDFTVQSGAMQFGFSNSRRSGFEF